MTGHVVTPAAPYRVVISGPGLAIDREVSRDLAEALAALADQSPDAETEAATQLYRTPENS